MTDWESLKRDGSAIVRKTMRPYGAVMFFRQLAKVNYHTIHLYKLGE